MKTKRFHRRTSVLDTYVACLAPHDLYSTLRICLFWAYASRWDMVETLAMPALLHLCCVVSRIIRENAHPQTAAAPFLKKRRYCFLVSKKRKHVTTRASHTGKFSLHVLKLPSCKELIKTGVGVGIRELAGSTLP